MSNKIKKLSGRGSKLDTVGVVGSIPIARTIFKSKKQTQVIEVPNDFIVLPALEYRHGRFRLFRVLTQNWPKKCDFSVTSNRPRSF